MLISSTSTCDINVIFGRFSTADLCRFTTGTPSEQLPFTLHVAVCVADFLCMYIRAVAVVMCIICKRVFHTVRRASMFRFCVDMYYF